MRRWSSVESARQVWALTCEMAASVDVAIIGAGAAGLSAAYLASQGNTRVTVYESSTQLGGHANTVEVRLRIISVPYRPYCVFTGACVHLIRGTILRFRGSGRWNYCGSIADVIVRFAKQAFGQPVDTGFLVYNENTYTNLCGLFEVRR